jgi:hypothetical protein
MEKLTRVEKIGLVFIALQLVQIAERLIGYFLAR